MTPALILASTSPFRKAMLANAGVRCRAESPGVDEAVVKGHMAGSDAAEVAVALAKAKALAVSENHPDDFVIGADQILSFDDRIFDKPRNRDEARDHLKKLRGKDHRLITAVCVIRNRAVQWTFEDTATLGMRWPSDAFLERYLDTIGADGLRSVGAYQIEGPGAQLFERIDGDYFTILGLPLLPLLAYLREVGVLET